MVVVFKRQTEEETTRLIFLFCFLWREGPINLNEGFSEEYDLRSPFQAPSLLGTVFHCNGIGCLFRLVRLEKDGTGFIPSFGQKVTYVQGVSSMFPFESAPAVGVSPRKSVKEEKNALAQVSWEAIPSISEGGPTRLKGYSKAQAVLESLHCLAEGS